MESGSPACRQCAARMGAGFGPSPESTEYESHPAMFASHPLGFIVTLVLCLAVVGLPILLVWWWRCKGTKLVLTDRRVILRQGILSRTTNEVYHRDVRNIQVHQTFFQRLMGVGSVAVSSAGQSGVEIEAANMPEPYRIEAIINEHRG